MSVQMLCRYRAATYAEWRAAFDADAERRGAAGLTVLQVWREAGSPNRVAVLLAAADAGRARAFRDDPRSRAWAARAGVEEADCRLLEPLGGD